MRKQSMLEIYTKGKNLIEEMSLRGFEKFLIDKDGDMNPLEIGRTLISICGWQAISKLHCLKLKCSDSITFEGKKL